MKLWKYEKRNRKQTCDRLHLFIIPLEYFSFPKTDNSCLALESTGKYLKFVWLSLEFIIQHRFRSDQWPNSPHPRRVWCPWSDLGGGSRGRVGTSQGDCDTVLQELWFPPGFHHWALLRWHPWGRNRQLLLRFFLEHLKDFSSFCFYTLLEDFFPFSVSTAEQ